MGKHAYLIMAHNQIELLKRLIECLDHERTDIFIHIDKKSKIEAVELKHCVRKSSLYFTDRVKVTWGGASQIWAELLLLEKAANIGKYDYYHLITGVDFPLKTQDQILRFFDQHNGVEFISCTRCTEDDMKRVKYYYWFQDTFGETTIGRFARKLTMEIEKLFRVQRNSDIKEWGIGSAYFDITDDFARYVICNKNYIKRHFRFTRCADEMFLQTVFLNSKFRKQKQLFVSNLKNHEYIQQKYLDVVRAIDWVRGRPYVYKASDLEMLEKSECCFARKFDYESAPEIIDVLYKRILEG